MNIRQQTKAAENIRKKIILFQILYIYNNLKITILIKPKNSNLYLAESISSEQVYCLYDAPTKEREKLGDNRSIKICHLPDNIQHNPGLQ